MAEHLIAPVEASASGTHRVVKVRNIEIGVFNVGGDFYALPNVCTHQFGPLCEGTVNGTTACDASTGWKFAWVKDGEIITCPWHGLEFDLTTGQCLAMPKVRLRSYPVTVEEGMVKLIL
ncbi:MAG TPA: Rieske 2Fe-2S domain-containing protein [Thermomicrobiales bacterium]|nr:Rieske 2Fe-2S domain-containing protein [Thermomicrobiales bacterium]